MNDEMDILREVGSIASGHGSMALSEILRRRINLEFPSLIVMNPAEIPAKLGMDKVAIVVYAKILVGMGGQLAIVFTKDNAHKLINLSYKIKEEEKDKPSFIAEMGISLLKELGNVIIASYLNALSLILKRMIIPPIPTLVSGSVDDILRIVVPCNTDAGESVIIKTVFEEPCDGIKGEFFLILTSDTVKDIRDTCNRLLNDMGK